MPIDRSFGSTGTIWSVVPEDLAPQTINAAPEIHYVGGTAVGLHAGPFGPTVVVWGWTPQFFNRFTLDTWTRLFLADFPAAGQPEELKRSDGVRFTPLTQHGTWAEPLATCDIPSGGLAVLLRVRGTRYTRFDPPTFLLVKVPERLPDRLANPVEMPVNSSWLFDPLRTPVRGNARITFSGPNLALVSTNTDRVCLSVISPQGARLAAAETSLGGPGSMLPGLVRLDIASLRFDGARFSITLTAHLNHPGAGAVSQGAILRLLADGRRDTSFGDNGLWVSPLTPQLRQFICAGEFDGGIVGVQETEAVAFGVASGGAGLDDLFGVDGVFRKPLGGRAVSAPVTADDGQMTYLFTQRSGDLLAVGCRFNRQGVIDNLMGAAGLAVLPSDGMPLTPAAAIVSAGRLAIATTRQVRGLDCDRIPGVAYLNVVSGRPDANFGAGGFAFHSAVGLQAAIRPDGSCYYTERLSQAGTMNLRRTDAFGRFQQVVPITAPNVAAAEIKSLYALEDGSRLIGGVGSPAWLRKLTPAGDPDVNIGVQGVAIPQPAVPGAIDILGARQDGRIAFSVYTDRLRFGLLQPDGSLDSTYAPAGGGLVEALGFEHYIGSGASVSIRAFLDADGSLLCALSTSHSKPDSPFVHFALRRITAGGVYDPNFGLDLQTVNPPASDKIMILANPQGGTSSLANYSQVQAQGFGWMGGKLYLIAWGIAGGVDQGYGPLPASSVLVATRWNADGTKDTAFGYFGVQEAGYYPLRIGFAPRGVLPLGATRLIVYGEAGQTENLTFTNGETTYTNTILRPPQPAIFSVTHPNGIDLSFGQDGAQFMRLQEFEAVVTAGRLLVTRRSRRVRFVCADVRNYRVGYYNSLSKLMSNFGGIGQFTL